MISAGQLNLGTGAAGQQQQQPAAYGGGYGTQMMPMFTPIMPQWQSNAVNWGNNTAPSMKGSLSDLNTTTTTTDPTTGQKTTVTDPAGAKTYLDHQMEYQGIGAGCSMLANMGSQIMQYCLASKGMEAQTEIACKYYDTQSTIAGYQRDVAVKQLDVQMTAINANEKMQGVECIHEETMQRLQGAAQARLAMISEQGKTDRAKILATTDAFSRNHYSYGSASIG